MPAGGSFPTWTTAEDDYLKATYASTPARAIAAHLGRSHAAVILRAGKYGLVSRKALGTASIRHGYFAAIDQPAKAYVLGLLAADGYVSSRNQVALVLSPKDRLAVEFVRDELAPAGRVVEFTTSRQTRMVRFTVQSPQLAVDLARHSVTRAKSLTLQWPDELPEKFANSYVGGYFDGDGSLGLTGNYPRWTVVSASVPFLEAVQQRAFNQTGTWIGGPYRDKRHSAWSIVATGRGQVQDLDAWIRAEVPGLARKRLGYDQVPDVPARSVC